MEVCGFMVLILQRRLVLFFLWCVGDVSQVFLILERMSLWSFQSLPLLRDQFLRIRPQYLVQINELVLVVVDHVADLPHLALLLHALR